MKKTLLALVAVASLSSSAQAAGYDIDQTHTNIGFSVRHAMVSTVKGQFKGFKGTVEFDEKKPEATKVDIEIDAASIDTNNEKRDGHLKTPDFFDVAKFPKLTFKSKSAKKDGDKVLVTGELEMHGIKKDVTLTVSDISPEVKNPYGMLLRGATVTGKLNRKEFGLNWNAAIEAGGVMVSEDVALSFDVELIKKVDAPAAPAAAPVKK